MKKLLSILGTIALTTSVASTTMAMAPATQQKIYEAGQDIFSEIDIKILEEMDIETIKTALVQSENDVILDTSIFEGKNLSKEIINMFKIYKAENTTKEAISEAWFNTEKSMESLVRINGWQVRATKPKTWYEWIVGVWRLEFNHALTQDIVGGSVLTSEFIGIILDAISSVPGLSAVVPLVGTIVSAILNLGSSGLDNADLGKGILIRFFSWIFPTKVTNSTYN